jgi:nucleotide-binding universal stress UspA family protein
MGSTATAMLSKSPCPVLAIPPEVQSAETPNS